MYHTFAVYPVDNLYVFSRGKEGRGRKGEPPGGGRGKEAKKVFFFIKIMTGKGSKSLYFYAWSSVLFTTLGYQLMMLWSLGLDSSSL